MSTWNSIGGAICVAISAAGLIASWLAWRKRGAISGMRGVAWSLIPLAAYLTNSVLLIGRIASAIGRFAAAFVFSPKSWAGVIVLAVALLLFVVSGGVPLLNWRKARERRHRAARAGHGDDAVGPRGGTARRLPGRRGGAPAPGPRGPAGRPGRRHERGRGDPAPARHQVASRASARAGRPGPPGPRRAAWAARAAGRRAARAAAAGAWREPPGNDLVVTSLSLFAQQPYRIMLLRRES